MGLAPVGAETHLDREGHLQREGALHPVNDQGREVLDLATGGLEDELVVHLQDHAALHAAHLLVDMHHGDLDDVGGAALDGGVDGDALGALAFVEVARGDLRDAAPSPQEGGNMAG